MMSPPLIKGYLPVRLHIPSKDGSDETFFYAKEHQQTGKNSSATLFVANAPTTPSVHTKRLLMALLGRFADVSSVSITVNPRQAARVEESWTDNFAPPRFLTAPPPGKFAHVVFQSSKELKKCWKALIQVMSEAYGGLTLEPIELQTLADDGGGMSDDGALVGISAVAERYRRSLCYDRQALLVECNTVMKQFEDEEATAARDASAEPDEDGFITVTGTTKVGSKRELEESDSRRKGHKRHRKRKDNTGASELQDFYRFQNKESRKKSLQQLRQQFEEDLAKVKKMKESRQYQPFGG